ncbi:MAG: cob(I)yrinic acid a,c-diamide adenosyltransferase [Actinomycetota bacterium]|nr:cob(I)yrinic acid a,c-diamide adenosyltransferase [Actinomycetota bacterium]
MRIYTRRGDDGTTGLLYGGRVRKDSPVPTACGDVDEAQAAIGLARAAAEPGSELDGLLVGVERDLWVLMAELATAPEHRHRLVAGQTQVTTDMVDALEPLIDDLTARFDAPRGFVLPGQTPVAAALDLARAVVRRAERSALAVTAAGSSVVPYLNRLSDLLWTMARWQEGRTLPARDHRRTE